jgi:hypothetical protein
MFLPTPTPTPTTALAYTLLLAQAKLLQCTSVGTFCNKLRSGLIATKRLILPVTLFIYKYILTFMFFFSRDLT